MHDIQYNEMQRSDKSLDEEVNLSGCLPVYCYSNKSNHTGPNRQVVPGAGTATSPKPETNSVNEGVLTGIMATVFVRAL